MFDHISRLSRVCILALMACVSLHAQRTVAPTARITAQIDDSKRTSLAGSVTPAIRNASDLGALPGTSAMSRMMLVLKPSDAQRKDLSLLIEKQQTAGSEQYHKWLTPDDFAKRFGPSADDAAKITGWLQSKGFTDVKLGRGGLLVEFSGTVASTQSAFGTSIHRFAKKTASGTETHIANATPVSIPEALTPVVSGVLSLNDFHSKPLHSDIVAATRNTNGKWVAAKGQATSTDGNGNFSFALAPADIKKIYGGASLPANIDGTGVSIAIIGRIDVQLTDIQSFRKIFSLPPNDPNFIVSGTDPGSESLGDMGESTLDLEWAGAVAPNATINFVTAGSTDTTDGIALAAAYAIENRVSPILSVSYGSCEMHNGPAGNLFWNSLWQQAAAEGISVFVSSGDGGAATCDADVQTYGDAVYGDTVNALASTPYNVAVGGTEFTEGDPLQYWDTNNGAGFGSALGYIPEAVWNESCDPNVATGQSNCNFGQTYFVAEGTGGGRSNCALGTQDAQGNVTCTGGYPKPSWQHGSGVPNDNVRDLPDVSLHASLANDPYLLCFFGGCQYTTGPNGQISLNQAGLVGGTSVSSPVMAAIMALVEQQNGQWQGQPNYNLYNLAAQSGSSCSSSARNDPTAKASCIFNDVTVGNNGVPGLPGYGTPTADFTAVTGYDLATGLGSVNIANLVTSWNSVTPAAATTTTLTAKTTAAKHGTALPIGVSVASSSGTPAGDVVLMTDKYGEGDINTLTSGAWSGNVADLPGGTYSLTARYAGNAAYASSTSAPVSLTIAPEDSTPTLSMLVLDPNNGGYIAGSSSPYFGATVYFKVTVAGVSGQGEATGAVTVYVDGTTSIASGALTADSGALLSSVNVPVGTHMLTVKYAGDNSFNPSTSAPVQITIGQGQSVTSPTLIGGPNSLTGAVLSVSGTTAPTGTMQLFDNGTAMGPAQPLATTGPVGDGYSQISLSHTYTPGKHTVQATYSGDSNYAPVALNSDSAFTRTFTVGDTSGTGVAVVTFRMTSASTLPQGQIATFVASVTPKNAGDPMPTGSVNIYGNDGELTAVTLVNGQGSAISYMDGAGVFTIKAQYTGDANYASVYSTNSTTLTVPKLNTPITFSTSAAYALPNTQVSLNFTATGQLINPYVEQDPVGTVTFTDSVNGAPATALGTFQIAFVNGMTGGYSNRFTLPLGTNLITATYNGNANYNVASGTTTVVVGQPDFLVTDGSASLNIAAGASGSVQLSLAPTLGYTGTVSLACGSGLPAGATCTIAPATVALGTAQTATVSVTTQAPSPSNTALRGTTMWPVAGVLFAAGVFVVCFPRRRRMGSLLCMTVLIGLGWLTMGCADSSDSPKATLLSISSSGTKVASGTAVTLSASLSSLSSTPTGSITFYDGSTPIGNASTLSSGTASVQVSNLTVGSHNITAKYSGDSKNVASTSATLSQVVTGNTTLQITATSGATVHTIAVPITLN